jgi:hypothetical protein
VAAEETSPVDLSGDGRGGEREKGRDIPGEAVKKFAILVVALY